MATILLITFIFMIASGVLLTHLEVKRENRKRRERMSRRVRGVRRDSLDCEKVKR